MVSSLKAIVVGSILGITNVLNVCISCKIIDNKKLSELLREQIFTSCEHFI